MIFLAGTYPLPFSIVNSISKTVSLLVVQITLSGFRTWKLDKLEPKSASSYEFLIRNFHCSFSQYSHFQSVV